MNGDTLLPLPSGVAWVCYRQDVDLQYLMLMMSGNCCIRLDFAGVYCRVVDHNHGLF